MKREACVGTWAVLALALLVPAAMAQADGPDDVTQRVERLFLATDEDLEDGLRRADDMAARGQWDRAIEILDKLLEQGRAKLAPSSSEVLHGSRNVLRAKLQALPPAGREVYRQLHDDAARRLLEQGQGRADVAPLLEVVARHPGSEAVRAARALLATRFVESGQPAATLAQLDALLERTDLGPADRVRFERARLIALALLGRRGDVERALQGLGPEPDADGDGLRLRAAAILRSLEPAPEEPPPSPAALAWAQPVFGYYETSTRSTRSWSVPEVDAAWAYAHDGSHALCTALGTGKLAWRVALRAEDAFRRPAVNEEHRVVLAPGLVVCLVPGVGLVALDRDTGVERWRRGLLALKREAGIDFPVRISGSPRLVGPRLVFALVTEHETREVHALAVHLATGELAWSAYLAGQTQGRPPQVELAATDERVVVITGLGVAVALDAQGEVLWARRYPSARDERDDRGGGGIRGMPRLRPDGTLGSTDKPERVPSSVVVRGTVWAAPADARRMWAWDLRDGEIEAVLEEPAGARILAARGTELVLVSAQGDVHVATKAGATLVAQVGGLLVGRPAVVGGRVYLPRSDGLVEVELATRSARQVAPPSEALGHLAGRDGLIISAAPSGLFAFGREKVPAELDTDAVAALADARPAAREAATAALLAEGEAARPRLEDTLANAGDPEARHRARVLLAELDRKDRLTRWSPLIKQDWLHQVPDLLNRITHPNPEVRLEALRGLAAVKDGDVSVLLTGLLQDPDARVAYTAAGTLLVRGDRAGVDLLERAVKDGVPSDRLAALDALREHGKPEDVARAHLALGAAEPEVRAAGVRAVLALGGGGAAPLVAPLVKDPEDAVRLAILEGCAATGDPRCLEVIMALGEDPNDQVRQGAIQALAKLPSREALRVVARSIGDPNPDIAKLALDALNDIVQTEDVLLVPPEALERGSRFKDDRMRNFVAQIAVRYLGEGGVLSVPTLSRFVRDEVRAIRTTHLRPSGRGWHHFLMTHVEQFPLSPADVAAVATNTHSADPDVRIKAYQLLGIAAFAPGAGAHLAQGLDDARPEIRRDCARWLTRPEAPAGLLDADAAYEVLRIAALSTRAEGRQAAAGVLASVPRGVLVPALLRGLSTPNDALRADAGARLGALSGGDPAFDPQAPDGARAAFAAWWWRETHPGETPEGVIQALSDDNPTTRWRAAQSLAELPLPASRNALAVSLAQERLEWVLDAKLAALVAVLGEPFGYKKGLSLAEKRACADRLRMRVAELIQDEVRRSMGR